jgi:hypothetical protein
MTFYDNDRMSNFLEYVHDTDKAIKWMDRNNIIWTHAMIYERRSRKKLDRIENPSNPIKKDEGLYILYKDNEVFKKGLDKKTAYSMYLKMNMEQPNSLWYYKSEFQNI